VTRREAGRVRALVEQAVHPGADLPAVRDTDAVAAFDAWLRAAPAPHRLLLRGLLCVPERAAGGPARELLLRLAAHCYYGDAQVLRQLGYDADAIVARATAVRAAEGRP
jgi:hypothetical protein